ncbi:unnamed protein product [Ambrosiozyma monospora]|uniref:Unnamed protein product n=1 Tax=Ambrosiozyma monospora TaxID=43982 RepID=A0A9W6Z1B9_AMBMO|nr:unnamed protein product [Ambrosiozyma monospora]
MEQPQQLPLNAIVELPGGQQAILRYVGSVESKNGVFAGVELMGDKKGKNSGEHNGKQYFKTSRPNSGLFLPYPKLLNSAQLLHSLSSKHSQPQSQSQSAPGSKRASRLSGFFSRNSSTLRPTSLNVTNHNMRNGSDSTNQTQPMASPSSIPEPIHTPVPISGIARSHSNSNSISTAASMIAQHSQSRSRTPLSMASGSTVDSPLRSQNSPPSADNSPLSNMTIKKQNNRLSADVLAHRNGSNPNVSRGGTGRENNSGNGTGSVRVSMSSLGMEMGTTPLAQLSSSSADEIVEKMKMREFDHLSKISAYETLLKDRSSILTDLQNTATELNLLLTEKEREITANEQRYEKYRRNADTQIKELLDNVEYLEKQSDENEKLYMGKLTDMENKLRQYEENGGVIVREVEVPAPSDGSSSDDARVKALEKKVESLESQLEEKDMKFQAFKVEKDKEINSLRKFEMDCFTKDVKIEDLNKKVQELELIKEAAAQITHAEKVKKLQQRLKDAESKLRDTEFQTGSMDEQLEKKNQTIKQLQNDVNDKQSQIDHLQNQVSTLTSSIEALTVKINTLQALQSSNSRSTSPENPRNSTLSTSSTLKNGGYSNVSTPTRSSKATMTQSSASPLHPDAVKSRSDSSTSTSSKSSSIGRDYSSAQSSMVDPLVGRRTSATGRVQSQSFSNSPKRDQETIINSNSPVADVEQQNQDAFVNEEGELKVFNPSSKIDFAAGRKDFCGLCERVGHMSIDCPYENDVF